MRKLLKAALGASILAAGTAQAQTAPDLQDLVVQSEQISRGATQAAEAGVRGEEDDEGVIDGEAGLYVLTLNEIFHLSASGAIGYTDNPLRTADDVGDSFYSDFAVSAGIATRLKEKVDFGLTASVGGREFFEAVGPSNRTAFGSASLGTPVIGPVYVGVVGFGGFSFDRDFTNASSFYGFSGSLSAAIPLGRKVLIRPGVGATRQWSGIAENNSKTVSASADLIVAVLPRVNASLRGAASIRWYDDFYEDVTFIARRDELYGVSAAVSWSPARNVSIAATASYEKQDSSFFLAEFDAWDASAGVVVALRF